MSAGFYACDSTTAPENPIGEQPFIGEILITPNSITFSEEDGYTDTTLAIEIFARIQNFPAPVAPRYSVTKKSSGEQISEEELETHDSRRFNYISTVSIETTTTSIEEYIINIFWETGSDSYAQTTFPINGFSNFPPQILETSNPEVVNRPASGEVPAVFTAKVIDDDGQETIDQVFIRVINQASGEVQGSPFQMHDDGTTYNDSTANDSVFTWYQPVLPNEEDPDRDFDIEFYAIDKGGLSSDTVRTTFSIRESN